MRVKVERERCRSRKLRGQDGETLIEVLVSLLIVVPALTMLAGALTTSARINAGMEEGNVQKYLPVMDYSSGTAAATTYAYTGSLSGDVAASFTGAGNLTVYNDDGKQMFYYFSDQVTEGTDEPEGGG